MSGENNNDNNGEQTAAAGEAAAAAAGPPKSTFSVSVPFAYGNMSYWLGKKAEESRTHKWQVYIRGINNEDLSPIVKSVTFQLHPSFKNPERVVEEPPFMITEYGWGEFEIKIRISLYPAEEGGVATVVNLKHMLALFPPDHSMKTSKPVVSEHYDEILFFEPPPPLVDRIQAIQRILPGGGMEGHFTPFSEEIELSRIQSAMRRVQAEIELLQSRYAIADGECAVLQHQVDHAIAAAAAAANPPPPPPQQQQQQLQPQQQQQLLQQPIQQQQQQVHPQYQQQPQQMMQTPAAATSYLPQTIGGGVVNSGMMVGGGGVAAPAPPAPYGIPQQQQPQYQQQYQ